MEFRTDDGVDLRGDLLVPAACSAAAIVCHPHPQYGGNRHNPMVDAVYRALPQVGIATLRFDFRARFDDGIGERHDATAAIDELRRQVPDVAVIATGYSFGAMIALALPDDQLAGRVLIAPPLGHSAAPAEVSTATLVLTPAHDQFAPPDVARPIVDSWPDADFEVIASADHFIAGQTSVVSDRVVGLVSDRWLPRSRA